MYKPIIVKNQDYQHLCKIKGDKDLFLGQKRIDKYILKTIASLGRIIEIN